MLSVRAPLHQRKIVHMMRRFIGSGCWPRRRRSCLELNFKLVRVTAGGALLNLRDDLKHDGYTLQQLPGGDYVLRIRHSSSNEVAVGVEQTFGMNCRAGPSLRDWPRPVQVPAGTTGHTISSSPPFRPT